MKRKFFSSIFSSVILNPQIQLDWDYEHDTRFFEQGDWENSEEKGANDQSEPVEKGPTPAEAMQGMKIRSRGRGNKKFLQALLSDDE